MIFETAPWMGDLPFEPPTNTLVADFAFSQAWPGAPAESVGTGTLICSSTGTVWSLKQIRERVDLLARSLCQQLGWKPDEGRPWDKIVGIFSLNAMDFLTLCWAVHRVGGICLLLHPTSSASEIQTHMQAVKCSTIFTNNVLLPICLEGAAGAGVPKDKVYILGLASDAATEQGQAENGLHTVQNLIDQGSSLSEIAPVSWDVDEDGIDRVAFLCPTSGTSGMQKLAIVTHRGVIANMMQGRVFEDAAERSSTPEVALGILPLTHSYGLITEHAMLWRGDALVLHPKFDMQTMLKSITQFKINRLYVVPPILAALANNPFLLDMCDLSSVNSAVTGAGGLSKDLSDRLQKLRPTWQMLPAYGLTETAVIASMTSKRSILIGSSGTLLPRYRARIIDADGKDVDGYDEAGELLLESPSIVRGYAYDEEATKNAFESPGWLRTGDVGLFRKAPDGTEHLFIVDRVKDMIKVKGLQVASSEVESCLRQHADVVDVAVVSVPHDRDGERAKAFVVKSPAAAGKDEEALKKDIAKHVQENMTEPHWLHRRVEFVNELPRNQAGKVLKYKLRMSS